MQGDVRSRRIAVVADAVLNPPSGGGDELAALERDGWGVMALWPPGLAGEALDGWREAVVDQVVTFLDDDYEVALVATGDPELEQFRSALAARGRAVSRELPAPER